MTGPFKVALVQCCSGPGPGKNLAAVSEMVRRARLDDGADMVMLPETVNMIEPDRRARLRKAHAQDDDPSLAAYRALAAETGAWILLGSLALKGAPGAERLVNRCFLIDAGGGIVASYDKIHMFDVDLGGGEVYRESKTYDAGGQARVAETPWGRFGLSICYDLRFPRLYRALAEAGARFLSIPAAFTVPSGKAHWHVLQRARAIENGCFVLAPAQCGQNAPGRATYGHSLAVNPWGEIIADGGEDVGWTTVTIDPAEIDAARAKIPSLANERTFDGP